MASPSIADQKRLLGSVLVGFPFVDCAQFQTLEPKAENGDLNS